MGTGGVGECPAAAPYGGTRGEEMTYGEALCNEG